jgi:hypothetical protein
MAEGVTRITDRTAMIAVDSATNRSGSVLYLLSTLIDRRPAHAGRHLRTADRLLRRRRTGGHLRVPVRAFGLLLGSLQSWAAQSNSVLPWFLFFWVLGTAVFVESDQALGIVIAVRHCLVAWCLYLALMVFYGHRAH